VSPRYRAVFLDVGETLVYAHPSPAEIMAAVCVEAGLDVTPATMEAADREVWPRVLAYQAQQAAHERYSLSPENSTRFWSWVYQEILSAAGVPADRRPDLARRLHQRFSTLETWRLYPDALPTLEALADMRRRDGLILGVISNWEDWLEGLLLQLEVHHYFDFLVVSAGVRSEKPDPAIFQAALQRAGTTPDEALHVGDSLHADVGGARTCGITPVLLDRNGRYSRDATGGAAIIRSLAELPPLLDGRAEGGSGRSG
jgi:putative hydrolase of the HAD superfamily